jgi:predicted esterase
MFTSSKYRNAIIFLICAFINLDFSIYSKNISCEPKLRDLKDNCNNNFFFNNLNNNPADTTSDSQNGKILDTVRCINKAGQSYALYVPVHYSPEKLWPIVYVFDPSARGKIPVELMKEAAEQYGYIIAASNNSRNGTLEPQIKAAQAMFDDTHERFAINDRCIYFAGFSGGARVAAFLARSCKCAQGVLLNSAGFSPDLSPLTKDNFSVFAIAGLTDFNYDEMVMLNETLDTLGIPHFLRRFNGTHEWAPKEVWQEGLAWMRLIEMKNRRLPIDSPLISSELTLSTQRAQSDEDTGNVYYAWQDYRNISNVFKGLADTKKIDAHIKTMEKKDAVIKGRKDEQKEVKDQIEIQNQVISAIQLMAKPKPKLLKGEQLDNYDVGGYTFKELQTQTQAAIHKITTNIETEKRPEKRRVYERARGIIPIYLIRAAQSAMDSNDLQIAKIFFGLAIELQPNETQPYISLARCLIRMGDKEEAIQKLGLARKNGLSVQALIDTVKQTSELSTLNDDPEFQKLISDKSSEK